MKWIAENIEFSSTSAAWIQCLFNIAIYNLIYVGFQLILVFFLLYGFCFIKYILSCKNFNFLFNIFLTFRQYSFIKSLSLISKEDKLVAFVWRRCGEDWALLLKLPGMLFPHTSSIAINWRDSLRGNASCVPVLTLQLCHLILAILVTVLQLIQYIK